MAFLIAERVMRIARWISAMKYQQNADGTLQWLDNRRRPQREGSFIPTLSQSINLDLKLISMFVTAFLKQKICVPGPFISAENCSRYYSGKLEQIERRIITFSSTDLYRIKRSGCRRFPVTDLSKVFSISQSVPGERKIRLRTVPSGMSMI